MKFNKIQVLTAMKQTGLIPVFYNSDLEVSKNIVKACYDGGIRAFEFTNRGEFAHEVFGELVKYAARECPEMIMGSFSSLARQRSATCAAAVKFVSGSTITNSSPP